jgi:hypothetical protein
MGLGDAVDSEKIPEKHELAIRKGRGGEQVKL